MSPREESSQRYVREEHETGFTAILARHLASTPGAIGAAIVDAEGEAVDYAGDTVDPFEIKVAAAHWRIVAADIETGKLAAHAGTLRRLVVLTDRRGFLVDLLPEGYALLSVLHANAAFGHADRSLDQTLRAIYREAGWNAPPGAFRWHPVDVEIDAKARPYKVRIRKQWVFVSPMGRIMAGLQPGEVGWRVDVPEAACETTLVLARDDRWYSDLPLEGDPADADVPG